MNAIEERLLRRSIELAALARRAGNHPFGAVLARASGETLLEAGNTVVTGRDCTRHAELNLVSEAARTLDAATLAGATLYASTEPCPMCAGAIYWAGIRRVAYGLPTGALARMAGGGLAIPCREVLGRGSEPVEVLGPWLEQEAAVPHRGFWGG